MPATKIKVSRKRIEDELISIKKGIEGHIDLDAFVVFDHTASIHVAVNLIASTPILLILIALVLTPLFYKT